MRILIVGAGAIGCHLAAQLAKQGADVHLIARGAQLQAIAANGLQFIGLQDRFTVPVPVSASVQGLGVFDVVLTAVKAYSLPGLWGDLQQAIGPQTQVVCAVNGVPWWYFAGQTGLLGNQPLERVDPGGVFFHGLGAAQAVGCVVLSANEIVAPGVVQNRSITNAFVLGAVLPGQALSGALDRLVELLPDASVSDNIRQVVWHKLLLNMGSSLLGCLTQSRSSQVAASPALLDIFRSIMQQGSQVAAALGVDVPPDLESRLERMRRNQHRCSMLQDFEAGRPLEIGSQLLAVQDIAKAYGVAIPTIDALIGLLQHQVQRRDEAFQLP